MSDQTKPDVLERLRHPQNAIPELRQVAIAEITALRAEVARLRDAAIQARMERDNYASQLTLSTKWLGESKRTRRLW